MYLAIFKSTLLMEMPGGIEWVLIILAVLVLFGGRKIPEFMRGLGKGIREFNSAKNNVKKEIEDGMNEEDEYVEHTEHTEHTTEDIKTPSERKHENPIKPH